MVINVLCVQLYINALTNSTIILNKCWHTCNEVKLINFFQSIIKPTT